VTSDTAGRSVRPSLRGKGPLDPPTEGLVAFAAAVAAGREPEIAAAAQELHRAGPPGEWVDELLLQSVLMVGYPRALVAAGVWRAVSGLPAPAADAAMGDMQAEWEARGIATCRTIYGGNYERLRANVQALHPALDRWMVVEGYGRVLSRPGLDLARRELCAVAQIAVLGAPRQLHSHLRGALQAGAPVDAVTAALKTAEPFLTPESRKLAVDIWGRMRESAENAEEAG